MRRKRTTIGEQFVVRTIRMLESPAYRALSLSAHRVLSRIEVELGHHGGTDNGNLPVTYGDFERYGVDRHSISAAIREAVALGFLEVTEPGRAGNAEFRSPNKFRLTFAYSSGVTPTHEWQRIGTAEEAMACAKAARRSVKIVRKNRNPVGGKTNFGGGNPHRKSQIHSGETHTTGHTGEIPTTSISRVRVHADGVAPGNTS
jgi:hypothetical protein